MRPIDADAILEKWERYGLDNGSVLGSHSGMVEAVLYDIENAPTLNVEPVRRGEWVLETHSFYKDTFDESVELCVYITARCKDCGRKHPDRYEVYSATLCAPEDADDDFRFDREEEEDKALKAFLAKGFVLADYCPNCGAKMVA